MSRGAPEADPSEHVCEACDEPFDAETELRRHIRRVGLVE